MSYLYCYFFPFRLSQITLSISSGTGAIYYQVAGGGERFSKSTVKYFAQKHNAMTQVRVQSDNPIQIAAVCQIKVIP